MKNSRAKKQNIATILPMKNEPLIVDLSLLSPENIKKVEQMYYDAHHKLLVKGNIDSVNDEMANEMIHAKAHSLLNTIQSIKGYLN